MWLLSAADVTCPMPLARTQHLARDRIATLPTACDCPLVVMSSWYGCCWLHYSSTTVLFTYATNSLSLSFVFVSFIFFYFCYLFMCATWILPGHRAHRPPPLTWNKFEVHPRVLRIGGSIFAFLSCMYNIIWLIAHSLFFLFLFFLNYNFVYYYILIFYVYKYLYTHLFWRWAILPAATTSCIY